MLKKLSHRFTLFAITALFVVELLMTLLINSLNLVYSVKQADEALAIITENNGKMPERWKRKNDLPPDGRAQTRRYSSDMRYVVRYFTANADGNEIVRIDTSHLSSVSSEEAEEYAREIFAGGRTEGFIEGYNLRYSVSDSPDGTRLAVVYDFSTQLDSDRRVMQISLVIALVLLVIFSLIIWAFSTRAVRPVMRNIEKQARFITDAGHELKTPLAIIRADAEVIEMSDGENEWTKSILNQTDRLSDLVAKMLMLAKAQESLRMEFSEVALSGLAQKAAEDINPLCTAQNKLLDTEIENDIYCRGQRKLLETALSILLENAVKYGSEGERITLGLKKSGRHAKLWVSNMCDDPPECDPDLLFERFYRGDSSRTRETGGSGIGLSTAKAIADSHNAKLSCDIDGKTVTFTLRFHIDRDKNAPDSARA